MRRFAFLIGNEKFTPESGLSDLAGPRNDVAALEAVLRDPDLGNFDVTTFPDQSRDVVMPALDEALNAAHPGDTMLLFYAGHGKLDKSGRLCLAMANTRASALYATSIPAAELRNLIASSNCGQVVLLLDCCYSGAVGREISRGDVESELVQMQDAQGLFVLTASTSYQTAREVETEASGAVMGKFTHAIVDGIKTGAADVNRDSLITVNDLRLHLVETLRGQTPQYWAREAVGREPVISRAGPAETPKQRRLRVLGEWYAGGHLLEDDYLAMAKMAADVGDGERLQMMRRLLDNPHTTAEAFIGAWHGVIRREGESTRLVEGRHEAASGREAGNPASPSRLEPPPAETIALRKAKAEAAAPEIMVPQAETRPGRSSQHPLLTRRRLALASAAAVAVGAGSVIYAIWPGGGLGDIRALEVGLNGTLWVGTDRGLARLDKDGSWQTYNKGSTKGGLPENSVWVLALGLEGALWIGTWRGLARLDKDGHWETYSNASTNGGLPSDDVRALAVGPDGTLWVGTVYGLARLDKDGHWQNYSGASTKGGLPSDNVNALALGPDGALWVAAWSQTGGLARLDKDGHWQTYTAANTNGGLLSDAVKALALGRDGTLWAGTISGLARRDKYGQWQGYTNASTYGGLPSGSVEALAVGQDGAIWAGTSSGLARLDTENNWRGYRIPGASGETSDNWVRALAVGPDGALWISTLGGLNRLNKDGHWRAYRK